VTGPRPKFPIIPAAVTDVLPPHRRPRGRGSKLPRETGITGALAGVGEGAVDVATGIPKFILATLRGLTNYTPEELRDPALQRHLREQGVDPEILLHESLKARGRGEPLGPLETLKAVGQGALTMGYDLQRSMQGGPLWEMGPNGPRLVSDNPEMSTREKARAVTNMAGNAALLAEGGARAGRARATLRANALLDDITRSMSGDLSTPATRAQLAPAESPTSIHPADWAQTAQRLQTRGRATQVGDLNREVPTFQRRAGRGPSLPKTYAILTAENPGGVSLSPAENASRMAHLRSQLRMLGREGIETQGAYTDPVSGELLHENGIMVKGLPVADAAKLSRQFGQNSFISQEGMHDLTSGTVEPIRNVEHGVPAEAPYTQLSNGQRFRMSFGAPKPLADVASEYRAGAGLSHERMPEVTAVSDAAGRQMAHAYEGLKSEPNNPAVRESYDALASEIGDQAKALRDAGYTWDFVDHDPYPNSKAMLKDLRENRHINVLRTSGSQGHPYWTPEQNNLFRAVHDIWGHGINEYSFGRVGEENAFRAHAHSLSPTAQRALATETRGQNSWFNFGPHADVPAATRPFATQKAALWPQELMGDYPTFPVERIASPSVKAVDGNYYYGLNHDLASEAAADALRATPEGRAMMERNKGDATVRGSQGFRTTLGRHITREEARTVAGATGQAPTLAKQYTQLHSSDISNPNNFAGEFPVPHDLIAAAQERIVPTPGAAANAATQPFESLQLPKALGEHTPAELDVLEAKIQRNRANAERALSEGAIGSTTPFDYDLQVLRDERARRSARPGHPIFSGEGAPTRSAEVRGGEPLLPKAEPSLISATVNRAPSGILSPHTRLFTDAQWADIFGPGPFSPQSGAPSLATLRDRFGPIEQRGSIIAPVEAGSILRPAQEAPWAAPEPQRLRNYMDIRDAAARALEHPLVNEDVQRGVERGFHDWYNADPIAKSAIDALGPEEGMRAFKRLMGYMRPTSIASSPEPNLRLAGYQYWRTGNPEAPRFAPGYRPLYPSQIEAKIAELENAGGTMNPVANPKLERYGQALGGNWAGLVGDRHFWRRMQHYGFEGNPKTAYGPVESAFADRMQQLADEGVLPVPEARSPTSAGQAAIWGGAGEATGVRNIENVQPTFYRIFEDAIHRSSRHAGIDPLDFLDRFWRRETPIF